MTNDELLRQKIKESGFLMGFVAQKAGLTRAGFWNKINNKSDFTAPEIKAISDLLGLTSDEKDAIFFAS